MFIKWRAVLGQYISEMIEMRQSVVLLMFFRCGAAALDAVQRAVNVTGYKPDHNRFPDYNSWLSPILKLPKHKRFTADRVHTFAYIDSRHCWLPFRPAACYDRTSTIGLYIISHYLLPKYTVFDSVLYKILYFMYIED